MTPDDFSKMLQGFTNKPVTRKTIGGNRLFLWIGVHPEDAKAICFCIYPPWRIEKAGNIHTTSADIPWEKESNETAADYKERCKTIYEQSDVLVESSICSIVFNTQTSDLLISFDNNYNLRTFTVWMEECWYLSDYENGLRYFVMPQQIRTETMTQE